jgi:hypothetical protein
MLGRLLVSDVLKEVLSAPLRSIFFDRFKLTQADILERVYRQPFPNRFLASLSPFLAQNIELPEIRTLVLNAFKAFLNRNVKQYDYRQHPVHFIGSIAFHYKDLLEEAISECGMQLGTIVQTPMEGLVLYHG